ncbi:MAG: GNAT family N-acetyltransferase, partial [Turicibacter sp.]
SQSDDLLKKCLFVLDNNGTVVATASLWDGHHFGVKLQRIHWVAVSNPCKGKGIAKALLSKVFEIYHEMGFKDYIYLTSQTYSYQALGLYTQFGFRPYMGVKPINWKSENYDDENEVAWKLIHEKLMK